MKWIDLTKWKLHHVDLAGVGVCAMLVLLSYFVGLRSLVLRQESLAEKEVRLGAQRRSAAKLVGNVAFLTSRLAGVKQALVENAIQLESADRVNHRIARVADVAAGCGLKIDGIQPEGPISGPRYRIVPIRLVGSGGFQTCAMLLRRFRQVFPDMAIVSFELSGNPQRPSTPAKFRTDLCWYTAAGNLSGKK